MNDDWRNNPKLAGMDRSKLDMLQNLASREVQRVQMRCCLS